MEYADIQYIPVALVEWNDTKERIREKNAHIDTLLSDVRSLENQNLRLQKQYNIWRVLFVVVNLGWGAYALWLLRACSLAG